MKDQTLSRWHRLWVLPPMALGVLVFMWLAGDKQAPTKADKDETAHAVRIIEAPQIDLIPTAEGYGAVQPDRVWSAVAQVKGRIVATHPRLRNGAILPKDVVLYRIDPVDYELNLAQARAELAELDVQEQNARASLGIEERNLAVAERELRRVRNLAKQGTASQSDADTAERTALNTRTAVQNINNTLALIPTKRAVLEAKVSQAERDLKHTEIKAPFNLRVANLQIETDQYVATGQTLFQGDAVDRVEIIAQFAMTSLRPLFISQNLTIDGTTAMSNLAELVALRPQVRLDLGNHVAEWDAEFVRFSDSVDTETRTIGVVIAVDRPFDKIIPGFRPPLSKGMFVQVVLQGPAQPGRVIVPRTAIRNGTVFLADEQNHLQSQATEVLFNQGGFSVIQSGIKAGDKVVLTDLIPAVPGMLLSPRIDETVKLELAALAGDGS